MITKRLFRFAGLPWRLCIGFLTGFGAPAYGQQLFLDHLGMEDGLSQSTVFAISQDVQGYMWFATQDGLSRYDGFGFKIYRANPGKQDPIGFGNVDGLLHDAENVFFGSQNGFFRLNRKTEQIIKIGDENGSHIIKGRRKNTFWMRLTPTYEVRYVDFDAAKVVPLFPKNALLVQTPDQQIWVINDALYQMDQDTIRPTKRADLPAKGILISGGLTHDGLLWTLQQEAHQVTFCTIEPQHLAQNCKTIPASLNLNFSTTKSTITSDGNIWLSYQSGLYRFHFDTGKLNQFPLAALDTPNEVQSLYADRQDNIWIGTFEGVYILRPTQRKIHVYREVTDGRTGLEKGYPWDLKAAPNGKIWIATTSGLQLFDPQTGQYESFIQPPSLHPSINFVQQVHTDRQGTVWIGTNRAGLYTLDVRTKRFVLRFPALNPDGSVFMRGIRYLGTDQRGRLIVGTSHGLALVNPQTQDIKWYFTKEPNILHRIVNVVYEDAKGWLWIGQDGGLVRLNPQTDEIKRYRPDRNDPQSLSAPNIWSFQPDLKDAGILWIGTIGGGLNRFDTRTGRTQRFTTSNGLGSNAIWSVMHDHDGHLWLGTSNGLSRFDLKTHTFVNYDERDGFQAKEYLMRSQFRAADGTLYFGGTNGIDRFHPRDLRQTGRPPTPVVSNFKVMGEPFPRPTIWQKEDHIYLRHDQNFFTFNLAVLDYVNPRKNTLRYRLVDLDSDWREADVAHATADYTGVPPGDYVLEVLGANRDRDWSSAPFRLYVHVVPAWYQTLWAKIALALLSIGGIFAFFYLREQRRIQAQRTKEQEEREAQKRMAESRERERIRIAQELHDGPIQHLYTLGHELDELVTINPKAAQARTHLNTIGHELRDLLAELRPAVISHLGLGAALRGLIRRAENRNPDLAFETFFEADGKRLPENTQHALYRIAQEALTNVLKHAQATEVSLTTSQRDGQFILTIRDNGKGFRVPERLLDLSEQEHYGLIGMMERVNLIEGHLNVYAQPNLGTTISVSVPNRLKA